MSKIGYTKSKILELLKQEAKTPTELGDALSLSLATISQHLKELMEMGAIEEINDEHFKKWKAYKVNQAFNNISPVFDKPKKDIVGSREKFVVGAVVVVIALTVAYFVLIRGSMANTSYGVVDIALTDPPDVPLGTQVLYMNYSSVSVYVTGNGTSEWIVASSESNSSRLNLLALTNVSQIIGSVLIPPGTRIDKVRFTIPSAEIVINGSIEPLVLRSNQITSDVVGNTTVGGRHEVLVELSPNVVPMYINGLTVFVLLSQVQCAAINTNTTQTDSMVGSVSALSKTQVASLQKAQPNLSLTGASLSVAGAHISLNITVTNPNENRPVILRDVLILGNQSLDNGTSIYSPAPLVPVTKGHTAVEFFVQNDSSLAFANVGYVSTSLERINYTYPYALSGYTLLPNQSVTLEFSGNLMLSNNVSILLTKGETYKISVLGDLIAHLSTNITAK